MCEVDNRSWELFSYIDLDQWALQDHPLRPIREMANAATAVLSDGLKNGWRIGA